MPFKPKSDPAVDEALIEMISFFFFFSTKQKTQGQGVSVHACTFATLSLCTCTGKFGLGGDGPRDFYRAGSVCVLKTRAMG